MKKIANFSLIFLTLLITGFDFGRVHAQGSSLNLDNPAYQTVNRLEILTGIRPDFHVSVRPLDRREITKYALRIDSTWTTEKSRLDQEDLDYIFKDNNEFLVESARPLTLTERKGEDKYTFNSDNKHPNYFTREKPIFKHFYKTPANLLEVGNEYFYLKLNPILDLGLMASNGADKIIFGNLRGVELRGGVDNRIYFYTNLLENQQLFPGYVNEFIDKNAAVPRNGKFRKYKSTLFDSDGAYDLLNSQAYVGFNATPHFGFELGHGRNFIGNGYRSMLLSDFAQNYFYLKMNWKVGRIHYQNLFAELHANSANAIPGNSLIPKKYFAAHYLDFNLTKNWTIGLFETVVFNRDQENGQFELQYLNPVILYRTAEIIIGSPDNVMLGFNSKINFKKQFQAYGQFIFDTFRFKEWVLENGRDWWGKKYGAQLGIQYINVANIDHLDLRAEFNVARPYTYAHRDSLGANYSHNNTSLAHPLGANFREVLAILSYQANPNLSFRARAIRARAGEDDADSNWGGNILLSYLNRERDFGNKIGQGITANTTLLGLEANYRLMHNTFLYGEFLFRKKTSEDATRNRNETYFGGGFRMNIGNYKLDF